MKITESQLKQLIRESLTEVMNEEEMEEGFWGGLKGAAKGIGQAVGGEWNKFKRGVMDNGLNNEYQGQSIGDRFKTAGKQIATGFRGGDMQQELGNIESTLMKLGDKSTFGGKMVLTTNNEYEALQTLLNAVRMAKRGSVGGVNAAAARRYGPSQQPAQQQRQVAESRLDNIIRESIKKYVK